MSPAEYMFTALLVLLAVAAYRARKRYFVSDQSNYHKIMMGLGMWLLMMLVRSAAVNKFGGGFLLENNQIYRSYLEALLLVAGGLLLAVGLLEWLRTLAAAGPKPAHNVKQRLITEVLPTLTVKILRAGRIREQLLALDNSLRKIMGYEILRLAIYDARGLNAAQYCLGDGGNLLTERSKSVPTSSTTLGKIFSEPAVTYQPNLAASKLDDDRWLAGCGMSAALTVPLRFGNRTLAAVTFAARGNHLYRFRDEDFTEALRNSLTPIIHAEQLQEELVAFNRRLLDLTATLKQMLTSDDRQQALSKILETLVTKLPITCGRIWNRAATEDALTLAAAASIRDLGDGVDPGATLPLAAAACHKQAIESGRLLVVNQADETSRMHQSEVKLAFPPGMQSALLLPLLVGSRPVGLLVLGEMRRWARRSFTLPETLFARAMANLAALALMTSDRETSLTTLGDRNRRLREAHAADRIFTSLPQRLATPLTSIMAKTDQLLSQSDQQDQNLVLNLEVIRRQSEAILREIRKLQEAREETALLV